ncbi:MAG: 3-dehydroquinate synthase [Oscillospiraceae bacterium]|nr:3-dehydroquinate synthase [Oscillospiraceae bacterium]
MIKVEVNASSSYDIFICSDLLKQVGESVMKLHSKARTVAIVTDETVAKLYLEAVATALFESGFIVHTYIITPGESSKSGTEYLALLEWLAQKQITRSDCIVALGGGVVGDLTGFAAATYLRGTPFIQVPTTLLAMVDSSVGGKTAINLESGKNLAGVFYQPSCVLCDVETLNTLSNETFCEGMAEIIKYGMLGDIALLEQLQNEPLAENLNNIIATCIRMKRDIVQNDEFDKGERQLLNFGHTIGHAIERQSGYKISHGNAVAMGMMIETGAAVKQSICPPECFSILKDLLQHFNIPSRIDYSSEELFNAALYDKKRTGDTITIIVPCEVGKCMLKKIKVDDLRDWIEMGLELCV